MTELPLRQSGYLVLGDQVMAVQLLYLQRQKPHCLTIWRLTANLVVVPHR
jgi:hypothetical protein